ncbi:MAG: sigma-70 family RNA polymerase sigma factor [Cyclobacteriaceae bacterium]|nr:sigma-70 family RNA polymerase sigma factor [Cyclobacteriaceae bacterium SS2]
MKKKSIIRELPGSESVESKFRRIYDELFLDLFIYAKSITKSEDLAKDAVSEVFLNLWANNSNLIGIKEIKSYLLVSVRNECIKLLYQADKIEAENSIGQIDKISPEDVLLEKELQEKLNSFISSLPDKCQLVFTACVIEKKSPREVAQEFDISVSTVNSHLSNAIKALRIEISNTYDSDLSDRYSNIVLGLSLAITLFS